MQRKVLKPGGIVVRARPAPWNAYCCEDQEQNEVYTISVMGSKGVSILLLSESEKQINFVEMSEDWPPWAYSYPLEAELMAVILWKEGIWQLCQWPWNWTSLNTATHLQASWCCAILDRIWILFCTRGRYRTVLQRQWLTLALEGHVMNPIVLFQVSIHAEDPILPGASVHVNDGHSNGSELGITVLLRLRYVVWPNQYDVHRLQCVYKTVLEELWTIL